jgi:hypothetical protein
LHNAMAFERALAGSSVKRGSLRNLTRSTGSEYRMERPAGRNASNLRQAAIDGELVGGHEAAVRRREKGGRCSDLRRMGYLTFCYRART